MLKGFFRKMFGRDPRQGKSAQSNAVTMTPEQFKQLIHNVARTQEVELNCGSTFELMDEYAEMIGRGDDAAAMMPLVQQHFDICPDCSEEYELLLSVVNSITAEED